MINNIGLDQRKQFGLRATELQFAKEKKRGDTNRLIFSDLCPLSKQIQYND